jgi:hypothetical protein
VDAIQLAATVTAPLARPAHRVITRKIVGIMKAALKYQTTKLDLHHCTLLLL